MALLSAASAAATATPRPCSASSCGATGRVPLVLHRGRHGAALQRLRTGLHAGRRVQRRRPHRPVPRARRSLDLVDFVVDSGVVGVEKPDPRIFRIACERAGVKPAEAVHVGDFYDIDVLGARAAGVHALLLDPTTCIRTPTATASAPSPSCRTGWHGRRVPDPPGDGGRDPGRPGRILARRHRLLLVGDRLLRRGRGRAGRRPPHPHRGAGPRGQPPRPPGRPRNPAPRPLRRRARSSASSSPPSASAGSAPTGASAPRCGLRGLRLPLDPVAVAHRRRRRIHPGGVAARRARRARAPVAGALFPEGVALWTA
jgi:hypothetical protein